MPKSQGRHISLGVLGNICGVGKSGAAQPRCHAGFIDFEAAVHKINSVGQCVAIQSWSDSLRDKGKTLTGQRSEAIKKPQTSSMRSESSIEILL